MPQSITAAGGVVYSISDEEGEQEPNILLIYRRKKWDLPKGKREEGESESECAVREVSEEVGVDPPGIVDNLGTTYHEYMRDGTRYAKTTYWYAMQLKRKESFEPQQKEDIEKVEWMSISEARKKVAFENLRELLDRFKNWLEEGRGS